MTGAGSKFLLFVCLHLCIVEGYILGKSTDCKRVSHVRNYIIASNINQCFEFEVTGTTNGNVWGTNVYTSDSTVGKAAVNAGLVREGQSKYVRLQVLPGLHYYKGSRLNGAQTGSFGRWILSYRFFGASRAAIKISSQLNKTPYRRIRSGGCVRVSNLVKHLKVRNIDRCFEIKVTGTMNGYVCGNKIYTADSSRGKAALFEGLVRRGQTKFVRVLVLPGRKSYQGARNHGVKTSMWGRYKLSFKFMTDADDDGSSPGASETTPSV